MRNKFIAFILTILIWLTGGFQAQAYRDLETGTFLTRDPAGMVDGPNLYTYVSQNPWTHFDPLGLSEDLGEGVRVNNNRVISGGNLWNPVEKDYINGTRLNDKVALGHFAEQTSKGIFAPVLPSLVANGAEHPAAMGGVLALGGIAAVETAGKSGGIAMPGVSSPSQKQTSSSPTTSASDTAIQTEMKVAEVIGETRVNPIIAKPGQIQTNVILQNCLAAMRHLCPINELHHKDR